MGEQAMLWFFRRVLDRLVARVMGVIATEIESHAQIELSDTRAALLRRAKELEQENVPGMEHVAAELRSRAELLGAAPGPGSEVAGYVEALHGEDLRNPEALRLPKAGNDSGVLAIESTNGAKRGRPRRARTAN
jgi:hypothetical protein